MEAFSFLAFDAEVKDSSTRDFLRKRTMAGMSVCRTVIVFNPGHKVSTGKYPKGKDQIVSGQGIKLISNWEN